MCGLLRRRDCDADTFLDMNDDHRLDGGDTQLFVERLLLGHSTDGSGRVASSCDTPASENPWASYRLTARTLRRERMPRHASMKGVAMAAPEPQRPEPPPALGD